MKNELMTSTALIDVPSFVAAEHSAFTAPNASLQGTAVPCDRTWHLVDVVPSGTVLGSTVLSSTVQVAFGARVASLQGSPPRGAPV